MRPVHRLTGAGEKMGSVTGNTSAAEHLRRRLLADMETDGLEPGDKLGSERALAERYGVSRGTLRGVLAALAEAGLVHQVPGRGGGTFVSHPKIERDMGAVVGLPHYLARQGFTAESTVLEARISIAPESVSEALALAPDALVVSVRRVRLADELPLSLDLAYFPSARFPGLLEHSLGGSLYELLEREYATVPDHAQEQIEIAAATREEATLLDISESDPLLLVRRTSFDDQGRPIEHSHDLFRGDRTRISVRTPGRGIRSRVRSTHGRVELRSV